LLEKTFERMTTAERLLTEGYKGYTGQDAESRTRIRLDVNHGLYMTDLKTGIQISRVWAAAYEEPDPKKAEMAREILRHQLTTLAAQGTLTRISRLSVSEGEPASPRFRIASTA
jgi:hypothetical protein